MAMDLKFLISAKDEATAVLNRVGSSFQKLGTDGSGSMDKIKTGVTTVNGLLGTLGVTLGAAAFMSWGKGLLDTADQLDEMSQKIGMAVEDLSALNYAAGFSGVSLEQLGVGMKQLNKNIVEASSGSKEQAAAFRALGVDILDTSGKVRVTKDVLYDVASRFAGMEDGAAKTAIAMKLFGKAGADLIPVLNEGAEGLDELAEKGKKTGAVLSAEAAESAARFNDNLDDLKSGAKGVGYALAEFLLPPLIKITDRLNAGIQADSWTSKLKNWSEALIRLNPFGYFLAEMTSTEKAVAKTEKKDAPKKPASTALEDYLKEREDTAEKAAKEEEKQLKELQQSYKEHAQKIIETEQKRWQKLEEGEKKYASLVKSALDAKIKEIDNLKERQTDITNTLDEIDKKRAEKLAPGIDPNLDAYDKYQSQISLLRKQEEAASNILDLDKRASTLTQIYDAWSQITEEITVGNDTIITQQDVLERSQVEMDRLRGKISAPFEEQKAAAEQSRSVLERMYDGAIQKASEYRQQVENLATMLDNLKDKDVTINFKATGLDQLQGIASLMSGTSSSSGGLRTYASLDDWWDSVHAGSSGWQTVTEFAGADGYDGWLASGGPVKPFGTYVVGEKGPEVLRMGSQGGTVIPNNKLGGITITGGLNLTLPNVTNQSTARDLARELYPELQRLSKNTRSA